MVARKIMILMAWLAVAVFYAPALCAQSLQFDLASVKPGSHPDAFGSMTGGPLPTGPYNMKGGDPTRITWTNARLIRVLQMAYDLPADRISGPGWLGVETYDIEATMPAGTSVADFKKMVQNLLVERFNLTVHREVKEVSGYWLEVAPGGLKIQEAKNAPPPEPSGRAGGSDPAITVPAGTFVDQSGFPAPLPNSPLSAAGGFGATIRLKDLFRSTVLNSSMAEIAKFLEPHAGAPVEDHSALMGKYDFHLEYKPSLPSVTAPGTDPRNADTADISIPAADLFDAVQAQLGLRLVRKKVPQEQLIIDRIDKVPSGN